MDVVGVEKFAKFLLKIDNVFDLIFLYLFFCLE